MPFSWQALASLVVATAMLVVAIVSRARRKAERAEATSASDPRVLAVALKASQLALAGYAQESVARAYATYWMQVVNEVAVTGYAQEAVARAHALYSAQMLKEIEERLKIAEETSAESTAVTAAKRGLKTGKP